MVGFALIARLFRLSRVLTRDGNPCRRIWYRLVRSPAHYGVSENPTFRLRGSTAGSTRARATLDKHRLSLPEARLTTRFEDLLEASDDMVVSIATPNDLHASQAIAAARAGKHIVLEKPTGLEEQELIGIRDAVRAARVRRLIVSFELRYNLFLMFAHRLRASGWLGERGLPHAHLSRVTDWPGGVGFAPREGRSHLLAAGCHAVDALRWCSGREVVEVSAFHTHFTEGYEWPTSILVNARLEGEPSVT